MQCFQKDPNLRVSARKLLRHAWIIGCRRADAPVSKAPDNFSQAVEEVKQWNKALESSESSLRASIGSDNAGAPTSRFTTPAKGRLSLAKPKFGADAFRQAEMAGKKSAQPLDKPSLLTKPTDDDNWDDDFATSISPDALQLPHLKPQDNFGGLLSSDKLKAFASINDGRNDSSNYDDDFGGEQLMTIKGPGPYQDVDSQEQTIRPPRRRGKAAGNHMRIKSTSSKAGGSSSSHTKSPAKPSFGSKFELPSRPDIVYREQSIEDYSDLFVDNDSLFNRNVNQAVKKKKVRQELACRWRILTRPGSPGATAKRRTTALPPIRPH